MRICSLVLLSLAVGAGSAIGDVHAVWTNRYDNGLPVSLHKPLGMALATDGNLIIAGTSSSTNGDADYVVLKYTTSGSLVWTARYNSTNTFNDQLNGFAVDGSGAVTLTGTGGTAKLNRNGSLLWSAPYAGNGVAVDANSNTLVTGFSTVDYATVKLDAVGNNVWLRTYDKINRTNISQAVAVDSNGNVFVAGWQTQGCDQFGCYTQPALLKYDESGYAIWTNALSGVGLSGESRGLISDAAGNVYYTGNVIGAGGLGYVSAKIASSGVVNWTYAYGSPKVASMRIGVNGNTYLTGEIFLTIRLATNGEPDWIVYRASGRANAMALDASENIFVSGSADGGFCTMKYKSDGSTVWEKRFNGPADGNDEATGIVVDQDGSIYVTGYSANTNGGSDITTIKYSELPFVQKKTDGSIQLQFFGAPGSNYGFQATTNFQVWSNLGYALADTNGLFQFIDTNAPLFPYRFYRYFFP